MAVLPLAFRDNVRILRFMKRRIAGSLTALGMFLVGGCAQLPSGTGRTTVRVWGTDGAPVTGYYVQNGHQIPFASQLPFTFTHDDLNELEIHKAQPDSQFSIAAQNDQYGWHREVMSQAGEGVTALKLVVKNGLAVEKSKD
jgi:hypothetical protein